MISAGSAIELGTVEDIGLRSLKLRTLDQNLLVVPNGVARADAVRKYEVSTQVASSTKASRYELKLEVEQLRFVLDRVQKMLDDHPAIESETSRVRVNGFAGAAFELELFAYGKTSDWAEFTAIRQDVILKIAGIVEAAGTRFAASTRLNYLSTDAGDTDKAHDILRRETELPTGDMALLPGEARAGTK